MIGQVVESALGRKERKQGHGERIVSQRSRYRRQGPGSLMIALTLDYRCLWQRNRITGRV